MAPDGWLTTGDDDLVRCWWCGSDKDYVAYHDRDWGVPSADDTQLFETLCLEGFQAGLSWLTVLRKRPRFREVFAGFDIDALAGFTDADIERLVADPAIIRHRGKIASAINNARRAAAVRDQVGSLAAFVWRYEPPDGHTGQPPLLSDTPESRSLSRDLKRQGWTFVGPTTVHAFMQAKGLVNDHLTGCARREVVEDARRRFVRPGS